MKTKQYSVPSMNHVEDLRDRLLDTYSRVEIVSCVKYTLNVIVMVAVGY